MSKKVRKNLSSVKECIQARLIVDKGQTFVIFKDRNILFDSVSQKALPGVTELITFLIKEGVDFALVSQDSYNVVANNLQKCGLQDFFPKDIIFTKERSEHEEEVFSSISKFAQKRNIKKDRLGQSYTNEVIHAVMNGQHSLSESILIDNCSGGVISAVFSNVEVVVTKVNYDEKDLQNIPPGYDYYVVDKVA